MFASQAAIFLYDAKSNELEGQITENSMILRLKHKNSSVRIDAINTQFDREKRIVRNEIDSLDDKTGDEYKELLTELKDLQDERDRQLDYEERISSDYEEKIDLENDLLQTQKEAIDADKEGFEEMLKKDIEKNFGYFK